MRHMPQFADQSFDIVLDKAHTCRIIHPAACDYSSLCCIICAPCRRVLCGSVLLHLQHNAFNFIDTKGDVLFITAC